MLQKNAKFSEALRYCSIITPKFFIKSKLFLNPLFTLRHCPTISGAGNLGLLGNKNLVHLIIRLQEALN